MAFSQQQLTHRNIEQWTAMTTPEDMIMGNMYAPTICTLTTAETRPFKPLKMHTESEADASSIRTDSDKEMDDQDEEDDGQRRSRKSSQELEDLIEEDDESEGTTIIKIPSPDKAAIPIANPFSSLPQSVASAQAVNLGVTSPPQQTPSDRIVSVFNGVYSGGGTVISGTRPDSESSGSSSNGGLQTPPTTSSSASTTPSLVSPTQQSSRLSSIPAKKPGFFKKTFNRFAGRQIVEVDTNAPTAEETEVRPPPYSFDRGFRHNVPYQYQPPTLSEYLAQRPNRTEPGGTEFSTIYFPPIGVNDSLFRQVEAESARRRQEEQKAREYEALSRSAGSVMRKNVSLTANSPFEDNIDMTPDQEAISFSTACHPASPPPSFASLPSLDDAGKYVNTHTNKQQQQHHQQSQNSEVHQEPPRTSTESPVRTNNSIMEQSKDDPDVSYVQVLSYAEAMYDFPGEDDGDLAFKKGQVIWVIEYLNMDWWRGILAKSVGIFPTAYVQKTPPRPDGKYPKIAIRQVKAGSSSSTTLKESLPLHSLFLDCEVIQYEKI
ncbi:MAG: hypothetical protein J3R72DRAFT_76310 [Linnemannia gamsii]|nr:MAG: hypothetical protein J3R72DRAFT_76310 [Linnemannia gamsii]